MNMKFQKQKGSSSYYVYYIGVYMSTLKRKVVGLTILRICPDFYQLHFMSRGCTLKAAM